MTKRSRNCSKKPILTKKGWAFSVSMEGGNMKEVKRIGDIEKLRKEGKFPDDLIEEIEEDLHIVHEWSDIDEECCFEDFDADDFGYGHIAIFDGAEEKQDYEKIGLTGGLEEITPETFEERLIGDIKWSRLVVVYNDSYSMILWLPSSIIKNNKAVDTLPSVSIAI